ncbi:MAG TPA: DUF1850 domain-containing protein [Trueperaceae bacterium]|nr:DUF1850 domain-containing protein [Trueperaceae bacterium]
MARASRDHDPRRACRSIGLRGAVAAAGLVLSGLALAAGDATPRLVVTTAAGEVLVDAALPGDMTWAIEWRHSVAQVTVVDQFAYRDGTMYVTGQVTPHLDIAGLGSFAGRGTMEQLPDGRYRLRDIDLPLHRNVHNVIIGTRRAPSVLVVSGQRYELTSMAPGAHARIEVVER